MRKRRAIIRKLKKLSITTSDREFKPFVLVVMLCAAICSFSIAAMIIPGTYAWFTSVVNIGSTDDVFRTAELKLKLIPNVAPDTYGFNEELQTLSAQSEFLELRDNSICKDEALTTWLQRLRVESIDLFDLIDPATAEQSGFAFRTYEIVNDSNIPVYFRISRAELSDGSSNSISALWSIENSSGGEVDEGFMILGKEYFYCSQQLDPGDKITIKFIVYIAETSESSLLRLLVESAEAIQVPNNAVFLHLGWSELRDELLD